MITQHESHGFCVPEIVSILYCRIDTDDDRRISKDEFTSEKIKPIIEKWVGKIDNWDYGTS